MVVEIAAVRVHSLLVDSRRILQCGDESDCCFGCLLVHVICLLMTIDLDLLIRDRNCYRIGVFRWKPPASARRWCFLS